MNHLSDTLGCDIHVGDVVQHVFHGCYATVEKVGRTLITVRTHLSDSRSAWLPGSVRKVEDATEAGQALAVAEAVRSRAEALAHPNAEPTLSGRCVGHLEWTDAGTSFVIHWHDPAGCEHVQ